MWTIINSKYRKDYTNLKYFPDCENHKIDIIKKFKEYAEEHPVELLLCNEFVEAKENMVNMENALETEKTGKWILQNIKNATRVFRGEFHHQGCFGHIGIITYCCVNGYNKNIV